MNEKNVTVMNLIDLKEIHECRVRINGKEFNVVSLIKKDGRLYAMLAGGYNVEVSQEYYDHLYEALTEHFKKHIFNK